MYGLKDKTEGLVKTDHLHYFVQKEHRDKKLSWNNNTTNIVHTYS